MKNIMIVLILIVSNFLFSEDFKEKSVLVTSSCAIF